MYIKVLLIARGLPALTPLLSSAWTVTQALDKRAGATRATPTMSKWAGRRWGGRGAEPWLTCCPEYLGGCSEKNSLFHKKLRNNVLLPQSKWKEGKHCYPLRHNLQFGLFLGDTAMHCPLLRADCKTTI